MNASVKPLAIAIGTSAAAHATSAPIYARNGQGESMDDLGKQLKEKLAKLDTMLEERQQRMTQLTAEEKQEFETRSKEIKDLASKVEQLQTDLVNQAKARQTDESSTIAGILVRNTESIEIAKAMLDKRQKNTSVSFSSEPNLISIAKLLSILTVSLPSR